MCAAVKDTADQRKTVKQVDDADRVVEGRGDGGSISCRGARIIVCGAWARNSAMDRDVVIQ